MCSSDSAKKVRGQGFGWLRTYSMGAIVAAATAKVAISEEDRDRNQFFNVVDVVNLAAENIEVWLDGNSNRKFVVIGGNSKSLNGSRFRELVLKNISATDTSADEVLVTIQKELGNLEKAELGVE